LVRSGAVHRQSGKLAKIGGLGPQILMGVTPPPNFKPNL